MCKKTRHSLCEVLPWLAAMALSSPVAVAREPGLLWAVEGQQNRVYLLGSVHLLRDADGVGLPVAAEAAYADAEGLVMEIDLDDPTVASPTAMLAEMQRSALLPAGQSLRDVLGSDYEAIARRVVAAGLDLAMLDPFAPWFVATLLLQVELAERGFRPELGVEQRIAERAVRDRKPIEGLETPAEQFAVLARLPLPLQKRFLQMTLEETGNIDTELERVLEAWRAGDAEALAELLSEGYEEFPELYGPLAEDRNRAWVEEISDLLDDADDYLVVVGALHLVGRDSVVDLLRRRGYEVTRQ
jgi:uncharacterized protein YbaP (TraB family)